MPQRAEKRIRNREQNTHSSVLYSNSKPRYGYTENLQHPTFTANFHNKEQRYVTKCFKAFGHSTIIDQLRTLKKIQQVKIIIKPLKVHTKRGWRIIINSFV